MKMKYTIISKAIVAVSICGNHNNASAFSSATFINRIGASHIIRNANTISRAQSDPTVVPIKTMEESNNSVVVESEAETNKTSLKMTKLPASTRLAGAVVTSVYSNESVDLSKFLTSSDDKAMLVLGTYAADFNAIEYAQRLRYYLPQLRARGISKIAFVLNCEAEAAKTLVELVDLMTDATSSDTDDKPIIELFIDPKGEAGRKFGVGRGWKPDDTNTSPYLKLLGMLVGLGAWATLPAVIGGYIGNPFLGQPWIEDALTVGQRKERWPSAALELDENTGDVTVNKFKELPLVGNWERRPLELATLRLQNMIDISVKNWKELAPSEDALEAGVLTQLGACVVTDSKTGEDLFQWKDPGICAVANFEDVLIKIPVV